jgi:transposase-like protein
MRKSKREMYPLVKLWFESSMQKKDFCKKHGISYHGLNYWIKKYNKGTHPVKPTAPSGFIPLTIKESLTRETGTTPEIELDLPHGIRLRIY